MGAGPTMALQPQSGAIFRGSRVHRISSPLSRATLTQRSGTKVVSIVTPPVRLTRRQTPPLRSQRRLANGLDARCVWASDVAGSLDFAEARRLIRDNMAKDSVPSLAIAVLSWR
jgi:hypothetical protein